MGGTGADRSGRGAPALWAGLSAAVGVQVVAEMLRPAADRFADLQVYRGAAGQLLAGASPYAYARANGDVFTYPPPAAWLLAWTAWPPLRVAELLWAVLTAAALVALAAAVASRLPGRTRDLTLVVPAVGLALAVTAPGRSDIAFGQVSMVVVALVAVDLLLVPPGRRGALLGVAIALKLTPLLFVPWLWLTGRRRAACVATATAAALVVLAAVARPADSDRYWTHDLLDSGRMVDAWIPGDQSLRAALERAQVPDAGVWWLVAAPLVAAAAVAVGVRLARSGEELLAVGTVGAGTVVVSPISWTHHLVWLVLPALWAVAQPRWRPAGLAALAVLTAGVVAAPPSWGPAGQLVTDARLLLALACLAAAAVVAHRRTRAGAPARVRRQNAVPWRTPGSPRPSGRPSHT